MLTQRSIWPFTRWDSAVFLIAALVLAPVVTIIFIALRPAQTEAGVILSTVLPLYLANSLQLMTLVAVLAAAIGVGAAWMVSRYDFPMRGFFSWALFLPLAVPSYIGAYAFVDFWEFAGPVQTLLRGIFGWETARDYWFFETRSMPVAGLVLALALYPYVYMLARSAFQDQSSRVMDVAQALGAQPWRRFWRVALPMARPAIAVGAALVMMETLNDFGAVEYFAVQTLTTGIFTTWLEAHNLAGAAQISLVLMGLVAILLFLERFGRLGLRVDQKHNRSDAARRAQLRGIKAWGFVLLCALPVIFGFVMPVAIMGSHALGTDAALGIKAFSNALVHSVLVAGLAGAGTVTLALLLLFAVQVAPTQWRRQLAQVSMLGYAMPGAVLAIGVLIPLAWADHRLADTIERLLGVDPGLVLTGSAFGIILAFMVRFFALGVGTMGSALGRSSPNLLASARALGAPPWQALRMVHLPLIRGPMVVAFLLIFVDGVKELPATLLLRPFGFETLATLIYNSASREDIEGASLASLVVIAVSVLAVLVVARTTKR